MVTKKLQEKITEAVKNPQEFANNLQDKNKEFAREAQQILLSLPQEILNHQKEMQERASNCVKKIQELASTQPVNTTGIQQTLLQFYTDNLAYQTKMTQDQLKKTQELFGIYTK